MSRSRPDGGECLDSEQYSEPSIRAYEAVYGRDFVSPGGKTMAHELITRLRLNSGARVLDAGCGLGGSAFLMAREFGARVDAVDLSHNMVAMAQSRCDELGLNDLVRLQHGNCLDLQRHDYYDAVYSRDVFLHIHDKARLFEVLLGALRPGGRLLFTDYCCGGKPWSEEFSHYVKMRAYSLLTLPQYVALLESAGFTDVGSSDWTSRFRAILDMELTRIRGANMDDRMRTKLEGGWEAKLRRVGAGDQRWGLLEARRP